MKHDGDKSNKRRKVLLKPIFLYSLAILTLCVGLLYVVFAKDVSNILNNFDFLMSVVLRAAIAYFFIEVAGFLHSYRKERPYRPTANERQDVIASAAEEISEEQMKEAPQDTPDQGLLGVEVKRPEPIPQMDDLVCRESKQKQEESTPASPSQVHFGFHGGDSAMREILDIIDGARQGPIFLVPVNDGILIGEKIREGQYLAFPRKEWLTETDLKYSPIAVCFQIDKLSYGAQKIKVQCDKEAILNREQGGLYKVIRKGHLIVENTV